MVASNEQPGDPSASLLLTSEKAVFCNCAHCKWLLRPPTWEQQYGRLWRPRFPRSAYHRPGQWQRPENFDQTLVFSRKCLTSHLPLIDTRTENWWKLWSNTIFKTRSHYPPPFVGHRYKDHWPPPFEGFDQPQKANWLSKAGTYEFVLEGLHNFQSCRHIWTKETVKRKGKNKIAQCKRKSHWLIWSQIYTIFTSCTDGLCQMNSLLVKKLWHRQGPLHLKTIYYQHHCVAVFTYLKFKTHYSNESESFNDLMTLRTWLSLTMTHQISLQCWYQR